MSKTGVWIIGAKGGVATTVVAGTLALRRGLAEPWGVVTATDLFAGVSLPRFSDLVFGGHDVRASTLLENARQISRETATLRGDLLAGIEPDLREVDARIRPGILHESGSAIEALADQDQVVGRGSPAEAVDRIAEDITAFRASIGPSTPIVVVNLASTEPSPPADPAHATAEGLRQRIDSGGKNLIASTLYAVAAARAGCAYVNFTPSPGALLPGVARTFEEASLPFMGSDGKTGETLVKSALAPMFKYRNLRVLSWQGYNMLGDRDGEVLAHDENKESKLDTKDTLLHRYFGYPLHTQVSIDFVPSLNDFKTAWDFVHFQGFLGCKMSLQFTWQGCDAVLAAPVVLDLIRLMSFSLRRGASGAQTQLSAFFKNPYGVDEHDLHFQFHHLLGYIEELRGGA